MWLCSCEKIGCAAVIAWNSVLDAAVFQHALNYIHRKIREVEAR